MSEPAEHKEALRQQMLLRALWRDTAPDALMGWLREAPERAQRGLAAYQANAAALAERALAAAFPTIVQLLGESSFAALARALWRAHAPGAGDMALWGEDLPSLIAAAESLAEEPYLADVARLDWAVHRAESAADAPAAAQGLERLAEIDPEQLALVLRPGTVVLCSAHPVVSIWQAHRRSDDERFAPVREAFAAGRGEQALVARAGLKAEVHAIGMAEARFAAALLKRRSLADALQLGDDEFDFEAWLITALQRGWLIGVTPL